MSPGLSGQPGNWTTSPPIVGRASRDIGVRYILPQGLFGNGLAGLNELALGSGIARKAQYRSPLCRSGNAKKSMAQSRGVLQIGDCLKASSSVYMMSAMASGMTERENEARCHRWPSPDRRKSLGGLNKNSCRRLYLPEAV
ncbi:hypothetical protein NXC24_PC02111 (plasmid) [Rhizobium sp. NXC24]|nr:hypothetical protein NXC24_PC02111 [Rhizobium sp. NXC24]